MTIIYIAVAVVSGITVALLGLSLLGGQNKKTAQPRETTKETGEEEKKKEEPKKDDKKTEVKSGEEKTREFEVKHWVALVAIVIFMAIFLLPWEWIKSASANGIFWKVLIGWICLNIASWLVWPDSEKGKRQLTAAANLIFFVAIGAIVYQNWGAINKQVPIAKAGGKVITKVEKILAPPPPEKKCWAGVQVITAPVSPDWSQALEVELPYCSHWELESMYPDTGSPFEVMAEGWPRAYAGSEPKAPRLPSSNKFKVRSTATIKNNKGELVPKPIRLELHWR